MVGPCRECSPFPILTASRGRAAVSCPAMVGCGLELSPWPRRAGCSHVGGPRHPVTGAGVRPSIRHRGADIGEQWDGAGTRGHVGSLDRCHQPGSRRLGGGGMVPGCMAAAHSCSSSPLQQLIPAAAEPLPEPCRPLCRASGPANPQLLLSLPQEPRRAGSTAGQPPPGWSVPWSKVEARGVLTPGGPAAR